MIDLNIGTALIAGILTFLAPCTLPLLPAFLGLTTGAGLDSRRNVFLRALGFVLGFIFVFMIFGLFAGSFGGFFIAHRDSLMRVGGAIVVLFSLLLLGVIHVPALASRVAPRISLPAVRSPFSAFLVGLAFAAGWTPCLGPILGSILVIASTEGTALRGAVLLMAYGLWIGIPFLVFALGFSEAAFRSTWFLRVSSWISIAGGVFLLVLGLALLFGFWGTLVSFLSSLSFFHRAMFMGEV
jgi:cytochrome c-type biogenesis protein